MSKSIQNNGRHNQAWNCTYSCPIYTITQVLERQTVNEAYNIQQNMNIKNKEGVGNKWMKEGRLYYMNPNHIFRAPAFADAHRPSVLESWSMPKIIGVDYFSQYIFIMNIVQTVHTMCAMFADRPWS